jgi:hypothetical protein
VYQIINQLLNLIHPFSIPHSPIPPFNYSTTNPPQCKSHSSTSSLSSALSPSPLPTAATRIMARVTESAMMGRLPRLVAELGRVMFFVVIAMEVRVSSFYILGFFFILCHFPSFSLTTVPK